MLNHKVLSNIKKEIDKHKLEFQLDGNNPQTSEAESREIVKGLPKSALTSDNEVTILLTQIKPIFG